MKLALDIPAASSGWKGSVWGWDQPLNSYCAALVYWYFIKFELGIESSPCYVNPNHAWFDSKMPKPTKALIVVVTHIRHNPPV